MKVKDMPYEHLTIEEIRGEMRAVIDEIKNAACHNCVLRARERMLKLMVRYQSNASLCYIRYSCNNHLAVVSVFNGDSCGGCFNAIAPQRLIDIASNRKMIICEYCGRILVNPDFE